MKFNAPIPGESLTGPPRKFPWERPPELVDPIDVAEFYLEKLADEDILDSLMDMLEGGMTIKDLTEGLVRLNVSRGMHTIDVGLLVGPIVHEALKSSADYLGIEYEEGIDDKEGRKKRKEASRLLKAKKMIEKIKPAALEEEEDLEEAGFEEEEEETAVPQGFMQRRGVE